MATLSKAQPVAPKNQNVTGTFFTDINSIKGTMAPSRTLDQIVEAGRRADQAIDRGRPHDIVQHVRANPKKLIEPVEALERREMAKASDAQTLREAAVVQAIRQALPDSRTTGVAESLSEIEMALTTRLGEIDSSIAGLGP